MKDQCKICGGSGLIYTEITVPVCCGNFTRGGECCGEALQGQDFDVEPCQACYLESVLGQRQNNESNEQ